MTAYERDGAAIYRRSFATIRDEADLGGIDDPVLERAVVRMIHACGMVDLVGDVAASPGFGAAAEHALAGGAPILCDTAMVAGITRARLPAGNDVVCTLGDPGVAELARAVGTTRSAAALEHWRDRLGGALVVVGNAPTALFRLLELVAEGAARPAAVIGVPVGFVGAAESKRALAEHPSAIEYLVVHGRRGGSAIAAAAVNALATVVE